MNRFLSLGILWAVGALVIYFYYIGYPFHSEIKDKTFFLYLFIVGILYGGYKFLQSMSLSKNIEIKASYLLYGFLAQYLLVCMYFFYVSGENIGLGVFLFFKSLLYIGASALVWMSMYCFGARLLSLSSSTEIKDRNVAILTQIGVGFIVLTFFLFCLASIGQYHLTSVAALFGGMIILSLPEWREMGRYFLFSGFSFQKKSGELLGNTALVINEFLFLVVSFLIGVNFLSVFRPFPIGWDDLGSYMNTPKLLFGAGEHLAIGKMYLWELYTGLGFIFGSQTLAFYLNSFSGIIAVLVITLCINTITASKLQKYNFGLLAATIFVMMPMVVFQIAKDMKIDIGLVSLSIIALSLLYYLLFTPKNNHYILYGLLGLFIGACFAIKVTSLLLLLGVIATLFFARWDMRGCIVFLLLFVGAFSLANIWGMMNIVVPGDIQTLRLFGAFTFGLGVLLFGALMLGNAKNTGNTFILQLCALLAGFTIALSPWIVKHAGEIPSDIVTAPTMLIGGYADAYRPDYSNIYSPEDLDAIESQMQTGLSASGITANEDWGRYFGYEKGINNFLKLPWNLSFQTNQKGEFTDITFLFLALIPGLFLFLPYRKEQYKYPVMGVMLLVLLYYVPGPVSLFLSSLFAHIELPIGYGVIVGLFLLPLFYFSWSLDKNHKITKIFLLSLCFLTVYMGLWALSSYGIVWYGIVMYFMLFVLMSLCLVSLEQESDMHMYVSYSVLAFVIIYALQSAIPHGITNIKSAGYSEYKMGYFNEEVSLMSYHPEYFPIMFELNISDDEKQKLFVEYRKRLLQSLSSTQDFEQILPQIQAYSSMNELHRLIVELSRVDFPDAINTDIQNIRQDLYEKVIYTPEALKNIENIYRVGTFLKYFISDNNTRLFGDSLLTSFENYIYDADAELVTQRLKALNLKYILLDLNAATIDQDPAKNLTKRYEKMIDFVKSPQVELIETDSICLRVALDSYKLEGNTQTYIALATVNHNSEFSQNQKRAACFTVIQNIISSEQAIQNYPYLLPYKNAIVNSDIDINNAEAVIGALSRLIRGNGFKALFKIN